MLVHVGHRHFGGDGAQCGFEFAGQQAVQVRGFESSATEGRGGHGDGGPIRADPDVELGLDVHAHPVLGDERVLLCARHGERQSVHVDRRDVVHDRPDEGAAVDHHLLAQKTGAHEGDLLCRATIEPVHHPVEDGDDDHRHDEPQDQLSDDLSGHCRFPSLITCPKFV